MNLKVYLAILWGNKWVILSTLLVTMAVVITLTFLTTPTYTATSTLRVATAAGGSVTYTDYMYADRLMNTYVKLATSAPVLGELTVKLGINKPPEVKVAIVPNTELIQLSIESPDPMLAQSAANTLGEILVTKSKELYSGGGKSPLEILADQLEQAEAELKQARLDYEALVASSPKATEEVAVANTTIELREKTYASLLEEYDQARLREALRANTISVVEPALTPESPSQPRVAINLILGFFVGLCGGVGLAFLVENLNSRLYTSEQIENLTGLTLLSKIPATKRKFLSPSNNGNHPPDMPLYEAFRRLRTNVLVQTSNGPSEGMLRSFLLTSAEPGEGKSTIAVHLAMAMARADQKVILVDADMRLPTLHELLDLPNSRGLSSILEKKASLKEVLQISHVQGLDVITSGPVPPNPSELLGSSRMGSLIQELYGQCDIVLIDAPAFLPVADAEVLAPLIDGVILVVRRIYIRLAAVRDVCKQLEDINIRPIGIVVNQAEQNGNYYYYRRR